MGTSCSVSACPHKIQVRRKKRENVTKSKLGACPICFFPVLSVYKPRRPGCMCGLAAAAGMPVQCGYNTETFSSFNFLFSSR